MASDWQEAHWGDIATLEYGKGLRGYQEANGAFRVFGTNGPIGWHSEPLCPFPSVIIGRKGAYRGIHFSSEPFFVIDTAFFLKPKKDFNVKWAYYELLTHDIDSMDSGSAIPSTNRESFYQQPVLIPPHEDQRAIAHILGTLDDKIEQNRKMNETLEAMAQAIFKSWFVDFDPVRAKAAGRDPGLPQHISDLFPNSFEDSELGLIPRGWIVSKVDSLAEIVGGSTPSTKESEYWNHGTYFWATPKDLSSITVPVLFETQKRITKEGLSRISSGLLPAGTVLLSSRAPIGYLAISEVPVAINQGFIAMKASAGKSNIFLLLWAKLAQNEILRRANGSTFLEISKTSFRSISLVEPPPKVMEAFDQQVRTIYNRIVLNVRASNVLASLRDTLLPKLISGELRVKEAEQHVSRKL